MNFSADPLHNLENLQAKNKTKSISIYLIVIIVLIGVLACLSFVEIDISSQSRGIIRPKTDNVALSTVISGKIIKANLKNNSNVTKGDTILVISRNNLKAQITLNDSLLAHGIEELIDYNHLINNHPDSIRELLILKGYQNYEAKLQSLQNRQSQAQQTYNRYYKLYKKEVIARAEYETHLYNLRFAKAAVKELKEQQLSTWQNNIHQIEETVESLKTKLLQLKSESENYILTAPISGTLENVLGLKPNTFINASQPLGSISPNDNLIVENTVMPNDIGLLQKGQKVNFQIDAFNYNQWGMLQGEIIDIDKNITLQDNTAFFKVRCSLYTKKLELKNGYKTEVKKGMTLTTRYFITRRSLFDLLFDKVDDWLNPKLISSQ